MRSPPMAGITEWWFGTGTDIRERTTRTTAGAPIIIRTPMAMASRGSPSHSVAVTTAVVTTAVGITAEGITAEVITNAV